MTRMYPRNRKNRRKRKGINVLVIFCEKTHNRPLSDEFEIKSDFDDLK